MKKKVTETDGWDCVPELKEVVEMLDEIDHFKYEIKNCVRLSGLEDIVYEMKDKMEECIKTLEGINTDIEYVTRHDDE